MSETGDLRAISLALLEHLLSKTLDLLLLAAELLVLLIKHLLKGPDHLCSCLSHLLGLLVVHLPHTRLLCLNLVSEHLIFSKVLVGQLPVLESRYNRILRSDVFQCPIQLSLHFLKLSLKELRVSASL